MKREYGLDSICKDPDSLVTVGSFDGVHLGHRQVLCYLVKRARSRKAKSVVLSFEPHPREVLAGEPIPLLTTIEERAELFEALGLDRFIVIEFTRAFSELSAESFVRQILVGRTGLREIIVGYDHGFGRGRRGNTRLLREMGRALGFAVDVVKAHSVESSVVSSSAIRRRLHAGDLRGASRMLGRPYGLSGLVVRGAARGGAIGYPTANLEVQCERKVLPCGGVYAVRVHRCGAAYGGMMNIGSRPTFGSEDTLHLEVHLFDFEDEIYGETLRVSFLERLRDEVAFAGADQLRHQLLEDERQSRAILQHCAEASEPQGK